MREVAIVALRSLMPGIAETEAEAQCDNCSMFLSAQKHDRKSKQVVVNLRALRGQRAWIRRRSNLLAGSPSRISSRLSWT